MNREEDVAAQIEKVRSWLLLDQCSDTLIE